MNTSDLHQTSAALKYGIDYCERTFTGSAGPVVNTYACGQQGLTRAIMWQIHQERKSALMSKVPVVNATT